MKLDASDLEHLRLLGELTSVFLMYEIQTCVFFSFSLVEYPDHQQLVAAHETLVMPLDTPTKKHTEIQIPH